MEKGNKIELWWEIFAALESSMARTGSVSLLRSALFMCGLLKLLDIFVIKKKEEKKSFFLQDRENLKQTTNVIKNSTES